VTELPDLLIAGDLPRAVTLSAVADGLEALFVADLARAARGVPNTVFVARDGERLQLIAQGLAFFAPDLEVIRLPAWDSMPYDRVSPSAQVQARRMAALSVLAARAEAADKA
jgi:transcription-repair coupling factor (superfamily II helicase)